MNDGTRNKITKNDRLKLIYAYIFSLVLIMLSTSGEITSRLYSKYGSRAINIVPFSTIFTLSMMSYIPYVLPPTVIRFVYLRRKLSYGLELYLNMLLSIAVCMLICFLMTGKIGVSIGFLGTLSLYCILSYGSTERNDIPNRLRYMLTAVTLVVPFVFLFVSIYLLSQIKNIVKIAPQGYFPLWEAIVLVIMLNTHRKGEDISAPDSTSVQEEANPTGYNYDDFTKIQDDTVRILVDAGLSSIGRKTRTPNPMLTPDSEQERRRIERQFLKQLAGKYKDEAARKTLAKHFMLYKETCLFIIYSVLLKHDIELHGRVKAELKKRLSSGLSVASGKWRDDYVMIFSKAFYYEYRNRHNISRTLSYMFWSIACEKYPELVKPSELPDLMQYSGLIEIYRYSYKTVDDVKLR